MSANPLRGEVEVELGGQAHVLRFSLNALAEVQDLFKVESLQEALKALEAAFGEQRTDLRLARSLLTIALRGGSWKEATEAEVGDLVGAEDFVKASEAMGLALRLGFAGGEKPRPRRAAAPKRATSPPPGAT